MGENVLRPKDIPNYKKICGISNELVDLSKGLKQVGWWNSAHEQFRTIDDKVIKNSEWSWKPVYIEIEKVKKRLRVKAARIVRVEE